MRLMSVCRNTNFLFRCIKNQAFSLVFLLLLTFSVEAQPKSPGGPGRTSRLSAQEAEEMLQNVRRGSLPTSMFSYFTLEQKSDRGRMLFLGNLWAMPLPDGPVFRLTVRSSQNNNVMLPQQSEFILKGGADSQCWKVHSAPEGGTVVERVLMNEPLLPSLSISCFDLLTPYLYWPVAEYVNSDRYINRPVQIYDMRQTETSLENEFVRISVDNSYHVLLRSEQWRAGSLIKNFKIRSIKKVDDQYIPNSIDFKDFNKDEKIRFSITDAALGTFFPLEMFDVNVLVDPVVINKSQLKQL